MDRISVEVIGVAGARRKLQQINMALVLKTKQQIVGSALKIETEAKRRAPSDTGRLRSSIQTDLFKAGFEANVFTDVAYARPVEEGTRPFFPPPNALRGWARRHNMEGLEFVIARAISRRGLPPRPFLFPAWEQERPHFLSQMRQILKRLERV